MRHDPEKSLEDIRDAAEFILDLTRGRTLDEYRNDRALSSAIERNFITVGEALNRLVRADPSTAASLGNYPQIIAFRNIVVHGYDQIEHPIVWGIIQNEVPKLLAAVRTRLKS